MRNREALIPLDSKTADLGSVERARLKAAACLVRHRERIAMKWTMLRYSGTSTKERATQRPKFLSMNGYQSNQIIAKLKETI